MTSPPTREWLLDKVSELQQRLANALDDQAVEADLDEAMRLLEETSPDYYTGECSWCGGPSMKDHKGECLFAALRARIKARREGKSA